MDNSHNNSMKGPNIALAAPHPDVEMGTLQPTPPVEDGVSSGSNANTMTKERKLDFDLKVSVLLITLSMIPLTDILFLHGPTAKLNLTLKLSAFIAFTAFASAVCLMFHTFKLMAIVKPEQFLPKSQLRASKILFSIAVGSLFLTCISITYSLLPKAYYLLPLALLPSLLVGGFHFLYGADTCLWSRCPSRGSSASSLPSTTRRPASAQHFPTPKSPFTSCSAEASPELWRCFCAGCCPAMAAVTVSRGHGKGRYLLPQTPP